MNATGPFGDQYGSAVSARAWQLGGKVSMGGTTFFIAVGGVSLILFWLMVRADRIRDRRRAYADSIASNTSSISSGNDGFGLLNWFSAAHLRRPTIPVPR